MGNAVVNSSAGFGAGFGAESHGSEFQGSGFGATAAFDGSAALKYHPSFYGPDQVRSWGGSDISSAAYGSGVSDVRVLREIPRRSDRESVRRSDSEHDYSRPYGGNFAHRNRIGVSRVEHEVYAEDVSWKTAFLGAVFTALAVLALVGIGALPRGDVAQTAGATDVVRVAAGESLSDIAAKVAPGRSRGAVIEQIMDLNAMSSSGLTVGQTLIVPVAQGN